MDQESVEDKECGKDFKSGNYPMEHCEGLAGFDIKIVAEDIIPWAKETKEFYIDTCESK